MIMYHFGEYMSFLHILNAKKNVIDFNHQKQPNGESNLLKMLGMPYSNIPSKKRVVLVYIIYLEENGTYEDIITQRHYSIQKLYGMNNLFAELTEGPDVVTPGTKMPIQKMKN